MVAWTDTAKDAYNVIIWPSPQFRKKRHPLYVYMRKRAWSDAHLEEMSRSNGKRNEKLQMLEGKVFPDIQPMGLKNLLCFLKLWINNNFYSYEIRSMKT